MNVNADFAQRVLLHGDENPWEDSPLKGVDRRRLDRVMADEERVTKILRYAPNSSFSSHVHTGGEEFIVLEGIFEDDYGDWPAGSYARNPPQFEHAHTKLKGGCTILVKLGQFDPTDRQFVHANHRKLGTVRDGARQDASLYTLCDEDEDVCFERWDAGPM